MKQICRWGRGHPEEYTDAMNLGEERFDSIDSDKKPRAGQILWIRGLTRLQTQLRVIRAFRSTLEDLNERRSVHSLHSLRSPRSGNIPGYPMYNVNYLNPNLKKQQQQRMQQQQQQQQEQQKPAAVPSEALLSEISYIDEDPQQQGNANRGGNGHSRQATFAGAAQRVQQHQQQQPQQKHQTETRI